MPIAARAVEKEFHVKVYFRQVPAGSKPKLKAAVKKRRSGVLSVVLRALILAIHSEEL